MRRNFKICKNKHDIRTSEARGTLAILPSEQCNEDEHRCRLHEREMILLILLIQQESKEHLYWHQPAVMDSPPVVNKL